MDTRSLAQARASLAETSNQGSDEWAEVQAFRDAINALRKRVARRAQFQSWSRDAFHGLEAALYDAEYAFTGEAAALLANVSDEALREYDERINARPRRGDEIEKLQHDRLFGRTGR